MSQTVQIHKKRTKTTKKGKTAKKRRREPPKDGWHNLDAPRGDVAVAGPIRQIKKFDLLNAFRENRMTPEELLARHVPVQSMFPIDPGTFRVLEASQMMEFEKEKDRRRKEGARTTTVYANPMQHLDYRIFENIQSSTIIGAMADALLKYVVGTGFKPVLKVIHPNEEDKEADQKLIDDNQQIIRDLIEIDRQVDGKAPTDGQVSTGKESKEGKEGKEEKDPKKTAEEEKKKTIDRMIRTVGADGKNETNTTSPAQQDALNMQKSLDVSFQQKVGAMIGSALYNNRGALHFRYTKPITIRGVDHVDAIPNIVTYAGAQDLGMIRVDDETGKMTHVQIRTRQEDFTPVQDMIYLWNPASTNKAHNSWFYGTSMLSPLISSSKLIRTLISETFPNMARSAWAGVFFIIVKNDGNTQASKQAEYEALAQHAVPGGQNILIKNPDDVKLENIDYNPKIKEFMELCMFLIKNAVSIFGLPQVAFFDESAANRSTMVGKIQLVLRTVVEPMRKWIGAEIVNQWYGPHYQYLYADQPDLLSKLEIDLDWGDIHISEWMDAIDAALSLDSRKELKETAMSNLLGLPNYPTMTVSDAEIVPGGTGAGGGGDRFDKGQQGGEGGAPFGNVKSTGAANKDAKKGEAASESKAKKVDRG